MGSVVFVLSGSWNVRAIMFYVENFKDFWVQDRIKQVEGERAETSSGLKRKEVLLINIMKLSKYLWKEERKT